MVKFLVVPVVMVSLLSGTIGIAQADNPHSGGATGQPNVECENFSGRPGNAASARGSAFNPNGTGHNAYETAGAPSQYDVACFQVSQHH